LTDFERSRNCSLLCKRFNIILPGRKEKEDKIRREKIDKKIKEK
jgi:hypothetical protein